MEQPKEDAGRPIRHGDAIAIYLRDGEMNGWSGLTAASDPYESVPGVWDVLVRQVTGTVTSAPLSRIYRCDVPPEVVQQVRAQAELCADAMFGFGEQLRAAGPIVLLES